MPVQVSYPGVYIQEIPSGVRTITGVATSIGAFLGRTAQGPINKAVRCLSYSDFLREFGGPHPLSDLGQSVRQFFDNGGTDCYVVRLAPGAANAGVTLRNLANTQSVLTATAKAPGLWGQDLKLEIDYNTTNPDDSFNLRVIYEKQGVVVNQEEHKNLSMNPGSPRFAPAFVTQSSKLIDLTLHADMGDPHQAGSFINTLANTPAGYSQSRRPFSGADEQAIADAFIAAVNAQIAAGHSRFLLSLNGSPDVSIDLNGIAFTATAAGFDLDNPANTLSADLEGFINAYAPLQAAVPGAAVTVSWNPVGANARVMRITSNFSSTAGDRTGVRVGRAPSGDLAGFLMLGLDQGGIEVARYSNLRPVFTGSLFVGGAAFGNFTSGIDTFAGLAQNQLTSITVSRAGQVAPPALPSVALNLVTAGNLMYEQAGGSLDGVREKLRLIVQAINADPNMPCTAELWGYHLALKKKSGAAGEALAVQTAPNAALGNGFIDNLRQYSLGPAGTATYSVGIAGSDGGAPGVPDYLGDPLLHQGFYALDKVDLFNLMVLPGDRELDEDEMSQIVGPASIYCQQKRAFLLLDAPAAWTDGDRPVATAIEVNNLRALVVKNQSAVFYPKVQYSDAGLRKLIGPSGMIAGLMARIDSTRGVWKAPAGIEADLRGVLDLEVNLTDLENGVLNKLGANCLRKFPNGIVCWGSRTLDGSDDIGSEWKYIPIRRFTLFLEESLYRGTKWVVFEPNDEPLWAQIRLNINAFMMGLFRQGAFQGTTPDKAFFVKCDAETTTQNDRNLGIVNIVVGFAPLKPAEFVIISIQQIAGDL